MRTPEEAARYALNHLKEKGADAAAVLAAHSTLHELNAQNGVFSLLRTTHDTSIALTVIKDQKHGLIAVNDLSDEAIDAAIDDCLQAAAATEPDPAWALCDTPNEKRFENVSALDLDRLLSRTQELLDTIKRDYPLVSIENVTSEYVSKESCYLNTYGVHYDERKAYYGVSLSFLGKRGDKASGFLYSSALTRDLDRPFIALGDIRAQLESA